VLTVTRIDRLARGTFDLFGVVKRIVERVTPTFCACSVVHLSRGAAV
jgi:hypothetical protein